MRPNLLKTPVLMKVQHSKQHQQQKQGGTKKGNNNGRRNLTTEPIKLVAHLGPSDVGVPFVSDEADGQGGTTTGEEQRHRDEVQENDH